jgi:N5-(carboxyethyl)ornithine synthase
MTEVAFVRPNYPGEKRVALLPEDVECVLEAGISPVIESGFGASLGVGDSEYVQAGARIASREEVFRVDVLFSLKLIQPTDYSLLRDGHKIIGWMHPLGSGRKFYSEVACPKNLQIVDLDSVYPRLYRRDTVIDLQIEPLHFFWKNSMFAGMASILLAERHMGLSPKVHDSVAVLGSGAVAQGAFMQLARIGFIPRMFYRKTLPSFYAGLSGFDVIVNGIEMDGEGHILDERQIRATQRGCLLIDAAADAGRSFEGTQYNSLERPVSSIYERRYLLVNNAPSLLFKEASQYISKVLAGGVLLQSLRCLA